MNRAAAGEQVRWAIRLLPAETLVSGTLRLRSGIEAHVDPLDETLWLRGTELPDPLDRELRKLAADGIFTVATDGAFFRQGARLPSGRLPQSGWVPLGDWLKPAPQSAAPLGRAPDRVRLRLYRCDEEQPAAVLLTRLEPWAAYGRTAPLVRLSVLSMAASADGRVIVRGSPLPSIRGVRYTEDSGVAVPCGWTFRPFVSLSVAARLAGLAKGDLAIFQVDGSHETIEASSFTRCTRAGIQQTLAERCP